MPTDKAMIVCKWLLMLAILLIGIANHSREPNGPMGDGPAEKAQDVDFPAFKTFIKRVSEGASSNDQDQQQLAVDIHDNAASGAHKITPPTTMLQVGAGPAITPPTTMLQVGAGPAELSHLLEGGRTLQQLHNLM